MTTNVKVEHIYPVAKSGCWDGCMVVLGVMGNLLLLACFYGFMYLTY